LAFTDFFVKFSIVAIPKAGGGDQPKIWFTGREKFYERMES
jgi:hypothetical protein